MQILGLHTVLLNIHIMYIACRGNRCKGNLFLELKTLTSAKYKGIFQRRLNLNVLWYITRNISEVIFHRLIIKLP
jgi:hypothetical protein